MPPFLMDDAIFFDCGISTQVTFVVHPKPGKGTYGYRKEYAFKDQATGQGS